MQYLYNISFPVLPNLPESVGLNIGMPVVRTDGRSFVRSVYGHVITKFSGMGRFTYPWCSAGARFAHESSAINTIFYNIYLLSCSAVCYNISLRSKRFCTV